MKTLSTNSKTRYSVNFPVEQTCLKSCPFYKSGKCYGLKGRFLFKSVREANERRLAYYLSDPVGFFETLKAEILKTKITHLRVNGIGDTPDKRFVELLVKLAGELPNVRFWVATRKVLFWDRVMLPDTITVRYSHGIKGTCTSSVTTDPEAATCPCTKGGVKDCFACGLKCWDRSVKHVSYLEH